jgi:hypothetical protein
MIVNYFSFFRNLVLDYVKIWNQLIHVIELDHHSSINGFLDNQTCDVM